MVALRGKEIDSFLARPDPGRPIVLLYGPDAGLVRERAEALLASAVDDPNDPFSLVRLDGDELSAEPSRLVDEALTIPLFGAPYVFAPARGVLPAASMRWRKHRSRIAASSSRPANCGPNPRCARPVSVPRPRSQLPAIPTPNVIWQN
jgi:hypothetical protein